jgi:avirulence protein
VGCFQSKFQTVTPRTQARISTDDPSQPAPGSTSAQTQRPARGSLTGLASRRRPSQPATTSTDAQAHQQSPAARTSPRLNLAPRGGRLPPGAHVPQGSLRPPGLNNSSPESFHTAHSSVATANVLSAAVERSNSLHSAADSDVSFLTDTEWLMGEGLQKNDGSKLPLNQQTLIGVARWPNLKPDMDIDQRKYGLAFSNKSLELATEIKDGKIEDIHQLWGKSREWRSSMCPDGDPAADSHKTARPTVTSDIPSYTPIYHDLKYGFMGKKVKDVVEGMVNREVDGMNVRKTPSKDEPTVTSYHLAATLKLDEDGPVELTKVEITFDSKHEKFHKGLRQSAFSNQLPSRQPNSEEIRAHFNTAENKMIHTDPKHVPALMKRADEVFQEVKRADATPNDRMRGLAEVHWLLTQAMPDARGSAAKSEMVVRSMAAAIDMELPPFKDGKVPDLEAFMMPLDQFKKEYPNLLEKAGSKEEE